MNQSFNDAKGKLHTAESRLAETEAELKNLSEYERKEGNNGHISIRFILKNYNVGEIEPMSGVERSAMIATVRKILEIRKCRRKEWVCEATATLKEEAEAL